MKEDLNKNWQRECKFARLFTTIIFQISYPMAKIVDKNRFFCYYFRSTPLPGINPVKKWSFRNTDKNIVYTV